MRIMGVKMNKGKLIVFIVGLIIIISAGMIYLYTDVATIDEETIKELERIQIERIEFECRINALEYVNRHYIEMEDEIEKQQLCSNQNCTKYFQDKIDAREKIINHYLINDLCGHFIFSEEEANLNDGSKNG